VLFINKTYQSGGAAIAARQIAESVKLEGIDVSFLVQSEVKPPVEGVESTSIGYLGRLKQVGLFILERLMFLRWEKSKRLRYAFSPAFTGENILNNTLIESCDIIHIHWFNQGFVSLKGLEKLIGSGKPIVWTLHDMWAITGGCHYAWDCTNYQDKCGVCPFLKQPSAHDLSSQMWKAKSSFYNSNNTVFVTVSQWLAGLVSKSSLGKDVPVKAIYNPIDTELFRPLDNKEARLKLGLNPNDKYILFGATRIDDQIKGINYLIAALDLIDEPVKVVVFGGPAKFDIDILDTFPVEVIYLGHVSKAEQPVIYSACDVICVPSEYETFGLVAAEAMACGSPVVAFDNSGVAEVVDHLKNGYLAQHRSVQELATGLQWVLNHKSPEQLSKSAREKIIQAFSEEYIGMQYAQLYKDLYQKMDV